jgi:CO/xanthine dehydrogenase FAD-binding subunit
MDLGTVTCLRPALTREDLVLLPGEALLGGGSWLFSEPQPQLTGLVDLTTLGWQPIEESPTGLRVAATCTIAELLDAVPHPLVRPCAESFLMSFKVWHQATVGGNVCLALPAGAMISLLTALDGVAEIWKPGGGVRREPVADLVRDVQRTTLAPGEVLRSLEIPASALTGRTSFRRLALSPIGRSATVVIGRRIGAKLVLWLTAATSRPVALRFDTTPTQGDIRRAVAGVDCWYDDPHGPADWRASITATLALEVCAELA